MNKRRVFGMVSTRASERYTPHALKSFFQTTSLAPQDRFLLILNDPHTDFACPYPNIEILHRQEPMSFAQNANRAMELASQQEADLFFLNNDLIFTSGWLEALSPREDTIASPLSNREVQYDHGGMKWKNVLALEDFIGHEEQLRELVRFHRAQQSGSQQVLSLPFFCIRIPLPIIRAVGPFDERFGRGGAEDDDYCLRAYEAGFRVEYRKASWVLHFSGKSTWSGAESHDQTESRVQKFREKFEEKWGETLRQVLIDKNSTPFESDPKARTLIEQGDLKGLVGYLKRGRAL